jgi:RNA polymerase sigma-70 factor (ECF subfamily)
MKDEAALIRAAKKRDRDAWIEIFEIYAPAIYKYVLRLCDDPVESDNIVGDVFTQLLEQFAAGKGPMTNLRSYIYETAYHLIVDRARRNQRLIPLEAVIDAPPKLATKSTQAQIEERALMDALIFALKTQLSELQRHVVILRFLENFSLRETAEIVGKNVNHVKVIQNRGIAKLRKSLKRAF